MLVKKNLALITILPIGIAIGCWIHPQTPTQNTNPHAAVYFSPGPGCENHIIAEIKHAQTIDAAVYTITNPNIVNALIEAKERGAKIRIVTDRKMAGNKYSLTGKLQAAGIPLQTNRHYKLEHNKFAVFDNKRVVTGSYNWSRSATNANSENCVFFDILPTEYTVRFQYLWNLYRR